MEKHNGLNNLKLILNNTKVIGGHLQFLKITNLVLKSYIVTWGNTVVDNNPMKYM